MANTVSDRRTDTTNRHPVARVQFAQQSWAAAVSTGISLSIPFNGELRHIVGTANNSTNAITYTTTIADSNGDTLYTKADWAENATELVVLTADTAVFIPDGSTVTITPSGVPGASTGLFDLTFIGV
jgi:hypothetical protein